MPPPRHISTTLQAGQAGGTTIDGPGYGLCTQGQLAHVNAGDLIAMQLTNATSGSVFLGLRRRQHTDNAAHLCSYGANTWGWEDTRGGGDFDFNDTRRAARLHQRQRARLAGVGYLSRPPAEATSCNRKSSGSCARPTHAWCAWSVKGIDYALSETPPTGSGAVAIHPFGEMPVMRHGDLTLFESRRSPPISTAPFRARASSPRAPPCRCSSSGCRSSTRRGPIAHGYPHLPLCLYRAEDGRRLARPCHDRGGAAELLRQQVAINSTRRWPRPAILSASSSPSPT